MNVWNTILDIFSTLYILVIHDEDRYSIEAGKSYLFMAIAGGLVMLFGIFLAFSRCTDSGGLNDSIVVLRNKNSRIEDNKSEWKHR